jgi:pimeloyl-ACP methyl ester carboxylesterase
MLRVVPGARHLANVDNPDEFNRYLKEFLASLK